MAREEGLRRGPHRETVCNMLFVAAVTAAGVLGVEMTADAFNATTWGAKQEWEAALGVLLILGAMALVVFGERKR